MNNDIRVSMVFALVFLIILNIFTSCQNNRENLVDKSKLLGKDYRLFQNTIAWELAKAVEDEDILKIRQVLNNNNRLVNFQEPRFGGTLLMFAIYNNQYKSFKTLLELGADPNLKNTDSGSNSVIYAADNEDLSFLKLILAYGGNPNSLETLNENENSDQVKNTALNVAISMSSNNCLEKVKLLVDAGANINYPRGGANSPLSHSIIHEKMDVTLYLLHKGANYKNVIYTRVDGENVYILKSLRECLIDLDNDQYVYKLKVINFLKENGLDYHNEAIPKHIIQNIKKKYPRNWQDYVVKY